MTGKVPPHSLLKRRRSAWTALRRSSVWSATRRRAALSTGCKATSAPFGTNQRATIARLIPVLDAFGTLMLYRCAAEHRRARFPISTVLRILVEQRQRWLRPRMLCVQSFTDALRPARITPLLQAIQVEWMARASRSTCGRSGIWMGQGSEEHRVPAGVMRRVPAQSQRQKHLTLPARARWSGQAALVPGLARCTQHPK